MELMFDTKSLAFWELISRKLLTQEETAELIVPDSFPDMERIVDSWAQILLRSKECRAGSIHVSGSVQAGLLFVAEGEQQPRRMECSIPFSMKLEDDALTQNSFAEYSGWIKSVNARMLNSRKAMMRVELCSDLSAWEKTTMQIPMLKEQTQDLQLRTNRYNVLRTMDLVERSITIKEEAEVPQGLPNLHTALDWTASMRVHECKAIGSRVAFRGELNVQVLYQAEDGSLNQCSLSIPVTQYVEMNRDVEGMIPSVRLCTTGRDLQIGEGGRRLYINLALLCQTRADNYEQMELLEDLYSTKDHIVPNWVQIPVKAYLDQRVLQQQLRKTVSAPAEQVERVQVFCEAPQQTRKGEEVVFTLPLRVQLLIRDASDALQEANERLNVEFSLNGSENCSYYTTAAVSDVYAAPVSGGVEVRCNAMLSVDTLREQSLDCVSAAQRVVQEKEKERPTMIVCRMEEGQSLWSVAKGCSASVAELMEVNHLQEEEVLSGTLLLIPLH
ncbi:MAG: DUF3794 domain-containing protein [Ruminococcaceae bacterium]|nr:DUF3794 domain-containing protein [Oscillospiraceae bacterium]